MSLADFPARGEPGLQAMPSLRRVLILQTQNAFHDNVVRFALLGLALVTLREPDAYKNILGVLISLPFILFAPVAAWVSDRFPARNILTICLVAQIVIVAMLLFFLHVENLTRATVGFFLLATQSAFFGPAKLGLWQESTGSLKLVAASGWLQMLTITGIVFGAVIGGQGFETVYLSTAAHDPWKAAFLPIAAIGVLAVFPLVMIRRLPVTPSLSGENWSAAILFRHFRDLAIVFQHRAIRLGSLGIAFFWFAGAFVLVALIQTASEIRPAESVAAVASSYMLSISFGVALGGVFMAAVSSKGFELGLIPIGGLGLALGAAMAGLAEPDSIGFYLSLFLLGLAGAAYLLPLHASLQDRADPSCRGRILASGKLMNSLAAVLANIAQGSLEAAGVSAQWQMLLLAAAAGALACCAMKLLPSETLRVMLKALLRVVYRVRVLGAHHVPREGGALMLANHVTWIDALLIGASCPREVRFVASKPFFDAPLIGRVLQIFNTIPIAPGNPRQAIKATAEAVKEGALVCIFPEGTLTRTGTLNELQKGFELIARQSGNAPIIPVHLDQLWGSLLSFAEGKFFFKRPRAFPYPVTVSFGKPIPASEGRRDVVREALLGLGVNAYRFRPQLHVTLAAALIGSLRGRPGATCLIERGEGGRRRVTRRAFLASALQLAECRRLDPSPDRIGVALPYGRKALLAHTGLVLAGKMPVPLPLEPKEAGLTPDALRDLMREMKITTLVTTRDCQTRHPEFPWPDQVIDLDKDLDAGVRPATWMRANFLPQRLLRRRLEHDETLDVRSHGDATAVLTNDSDGKPSYRFLSHRAVLTNAAQIADANIFRKTERLANGYPLHRVPGQCLGAWLPLLKRMEILVTTADDTAISFESLVERENVTSVIAGSKQARTLLSLPLEARTCPLRQIITFAPWRCDDVFRQLESRRSSLVLHGWVSPRWNQVVSMSMAEPDSPLPQGGHKPGASGRLLPGVCLLAQPDEQGHLFGFHPLSPAPDGDEIPTPEHVGARGTIDQEGFLFLEFSESPAPPADGPSD